MSASAPTTGRRGGWGVAAAVAGATVLAMFALGGSDPSRGEPLDPRSDGRLGTSALVALLGDLGAEVDVSDELPGDDTDVAVLLVDLLEPDEVDELRAWVARGGVLVVVDPASALTPSTGRSFEDLDDLRATVDGPLTCDVTPLDGLDVEGVEPRSGGVLYDVPFAADSCLGDGDEAYVVAAPEGAGTIVALGGSGMLVNAGLAEGENAPVVAALMAPLAGTRVTVLEPVPLAGAGDSTLVELVSPPVRRAIVQLGVAFGIFALWRARRLGTPVAEPQPVAVAGSELVAAVGSLLDRARSPQHAADLLRQDLRRFLADRLGVPAGSPPDVMANVAAARVGADAARVSWALGPSPVTDDAQLVALAQSIDAIRQEVLAHV